MKRAAGLYEELITEELAALLEQAEWVTHEAALSQDGAADLLPRHLHTAAKRALEAATGNAPARKKSTYRRHMASVAPGWS